MCDLSDRSATLKVVSQHKMPGKGSGAIDVIVWQTSPMRLLYVK
jgi:hypothetical protein